MTPFKILIIEDEIIIADGIKRFLTKKGHHVVGIAISYEEGEQLYIQEKPDITLIDIRLNGIKTGIDFAHFIQKQPSPRPFLFLTSQLDAKNIHNAKQTFPAGYLSKPIQKDSLYASIEIAMHNFLSNKEEVTTISLNDGIKNYLIPIQNILFLQADHVYVKVYIQEKDYLLQRSSLKSILEQLPIEQFIQTHRSFAVNIKKVNHWDTENIYILDKIIPVSRSRKKAVFSQLSSRT